MAESSSTAQTRDFSFVLRTPSVLEKAVDALSDPVLNPLQQAMIQVGDYGFYIKVDVTDKETKKQIVCSLCFKATGLQEFQCNMPLQKMVSLKSINQLLEDASKNDHRGITIFSLSGSKKLSFHWGGSVPGFEFGLPISIRLYDLKPGQEQFPAVSDYGFEAVIPSDLLKYALKSLFRSRRKPTTAEATLIAPRVKIILDNKITLNTEEEAERHHVSFGGNCWELLQKATSLADKCSMYLIKDPPQLSPYVMLQFILGELGDLVYLIPARFLTDNTLNDLSPR